MKSFKQSSYNKFFIVIKSPLEDSVNRKFYKELIFDQESF